jgi:hypothetical protein
MRFLGTPTNIAFLIAVAEHPAPRPETRIRTSSASTCKDGARPLATLTSL